jgi:hypothetical protein
MGLTAFLTTFLLGFNSTQAEYHLLPEKARSKLKGCIQKEKETQELFL